jgi:hypothetical protein
MNRLTRSDLMSLEQYSTARKISRARCWRIRGIGSSALGRMRLVLRDRLTIQYQVQEMLRVERIFEAAGIQDELDAYNPSFRRQQLEVTFLIEFRTPKNAICAFQA